MTTKKLVILAMSSTLVFVFKIALFFIPNIELVTYLLIIFTLVYGLKDAIIIAFVYTILEIIVWGISEQFYIWVIIVLLTALLKKLFKENFILWAIYSGLLGLLFGLLCTIPIFLLTDYTFALTYYINGLRYDVPHLIGNYIFMLLFGEIGYNKLKTLLNQYYK
ncbi:hypothetical protein KHQ81_13350 [Mycoplasmatota bacterium]|nr:hypothetical protein KHQ81_13350 [Mycoplasmatota bacterium]